MDLLFEKLNAITALSPPLKSYLVSHIESLPFIIHSYMPYHSFRSTMLYFVSSGYVGGVKLSNNKQLPLTIFSQGDFIIPSLTKSKKEFISALSFYTPAVLLAITLDDAKYALERFPEAFTLLITIIDEQIDNGNKRELLLRMPPKERYANLLATRPRLLLHCKSQQLADYLNISERNFTRFKHAK